MYIDTTHDATVNGRKQGGGALENKRNSSKYHVEKQMANEIRPSPRIDQPVTVHLADVTR